MTVEYVLWWKYKNQNLGWSYMRKSHTDDFDDDIAVAERSKIPWKVVRQETTVKETVVRESK